jgi:alpha-L-fucosidase 2
MTKADLWYDKPAEYWEGALPLGNGHLGAMVFGGTEREQIHLNHDEIWSGPGEYELDPSNPEKVKEAQNLIRAGKLKEAHDYIIANILLTRDECQSYQTGGSLFINTDHTGVKNYRRSLSFSNALSLVEYEYKGVAYKRECFSSYPDQLIVCRLSSDKKGSISCRTNFESPMPFFIPSTLSQNSVCARGRAANMNPDYAPDRRSYQINDVWNEDNRKTPSIRYINLLSAKAEGGEISTADGEITVENADSVTFYLTIVTNFDGPGFAPGSAGRDIEKEAAEIISRAEKKGFDKLLADHMADHSALFNRVEFQLGSEPEEELPTDKQLQACKNPSEHPHLIKKLFDYGRYLLIASSRPGTEPANLQGIWNQLMQAPWGGRYTVNINTEMNYWPAQVCNLSECEEPFLRMVSELSVSGRETAQILYDSEDGWCSHHNTDLWRWSAYVHWGVPAAYWPLSGGWLSRNIYEKYLFDGDISYLAENFPILRGASRFFLDYMIETEEGKLVTSPATSAENTFIDPETGLPVGASEGSAIDQSIIREIFEHTLAAAELLDKEDPLLAEIQEALPRLEEHKIGSHGQILEFQHDYEEYDIHHRHVSHLYGAFPGSEFTPDRNPLLFEAAQKTLERRGDISTGGVWGGVSVSGPVSLMETVPLM